MIKCNWARRYDRRVYACRLCLAPHTPKQTSNSNPLSFDRCKAVEKCWLTSAWRISQPPVVAFTSLRLAARGKSTSSHPQEIRLGGIIKPAILQVAKRLKTRGKRTGSTLLTRDGWKQVRGQRRAFRPSLLSKFPFVHLAWAAPRGPSFSRFTAFRFFLDVGRTNAVKKRIVGFLTRRFSFFATVFLIRIFFPRLVPVLGRLEIRLITFESFKWVERWEFRKNIEDLARVILRRQLYKLFNVPSRFSHLRLRTVTRKISLLFSKSTTCL